MVTISEHDGFVTIHRCAHRWERICRLIAELPGVRTFMLGSLDGTSEPDFLRSYAEELLGVEKSDWLHPILPVFDKKNFDRLELSNEAHFPGMDAIWFGSRVPENEGEQSPCNIWYLAAPWEYVKVDETDLQALAAWLKRGDWIAGVARDMEVIVVDLGQNDLSLLSEHR
jgi:hypothetical protein